MLQLDTDLGVLGAGRPPVPLQSIDFELNSSQYLSISDANFGAYNKAKFAISLWVKRESTSNTMFLYSHNGGGSNRAFDLFFDSDDTLVFRASQSGSTYGGQLTTSAAYASTSTFYHILAHYDSANATAGDRMRLWVNGSEVTSFSIDTNPSTSVFDSTATVKVGGNPDQGSVPFDGLIYQASFFSGSLPSIGNLYSAGKPLSVTGLAGIFSTLDVDASSVTHDGILASSWTNNNTAIASSVTP